MGSARLYTHGAESQNSEESYEVHLCGMYESSSCVEMGCCLMELLAGSVASAFGCVKMMVIVMSRFLLGIQAPGLLGLYVLPSLSWHDRLLLSDLD